MLDQAIRDFPKQFAYEPTVENAALLKRVSKFVVCGMGGSNHATDILKAWRPEVDAVTHRDYGLPALPDLARRLVIACSYSGNTEEPIDAFNVARERGLAVAAVSTDGRLQALAREARAPFVALPAVNIQPRSATGFMLVALLKLMGAEEGLKELRSLATILQPTALTDQGRLIAEKLAGRVPVIYASTRNWAVANNWKIKINENTKIPAFANVFPELNHNEMNGFDVTDITRSITSPFHFIFLRDSDDDPRIAKRLDVLDKLYRQRGLPVEILDFTGSMRLEKIFTSLIIADWVSYHLAVALGIDPEPVPLVEEFKKLIE